MKYLITYEDRSEVVEAPEIGAALLDFCTRMAEEKFATTDVEEFALDTRKIRVQMAVGDSFVPLQIPSEN